MTQTPIPILLAGESLQLEHMSLLHDGWQATLTAPGDIATCDMTEYDIVILDVDPMGATGKAVTATVRGAGFAGPVLYLTDREDVAGVTGVGDAFLTRPYSLEQLAASLRDLARHALDIRGDRPDPVLRAGELSLNEDSHEVSRGGEQLQLTGGEFALLRYLIRYPDRVHSRAQILDRVWPLGYAGKATVVELYVSYLRNKLRRSKSDPQIITTVRGTGYLLKSRA